MNTRTYPWAVTQDQLPTKLEATRGFVSDLPMVVLSGYRNPVKNDSLTPTPGVFNSRHQWGDAADVCATDYNGDGLTDEVDTAILSAAASSAGFNEVMPKTHCVHMASK